MQDVKIMNKKDLYRRTGWFSKDCERLINRLAEHGLVIVDNAELTKYLERMDDDLK